MICLNTLTKIFHSADRQVCNPCSSLKIEAEWTQHIEVNIEGKKHKLEEKYKLEGQVSNRGAKIRFYKWDTLYNRFEKKSSGYAYLSKDNQQLMIMIFEYEKFPFMTIKRGKSTFITANRKQTNE